MGLKRLPWTSTMLLQLAINSQCLNLLYTTTIAAAFLLGFHSINQAPPAKNGPATATILIKPECLAHLCVEQAFLYPWMCHTSWFELHRSQDERFSTPCQNASTTATITIKLECLTHSCVEQVFLYA